MNKNKKSPGEVFQGSVVVLTKSLIPRVKIAAKYIADLSVKSYDKWRKNENHRHR